MSKTKYSEIYLEYLVEQLPGEERVRFEQHLTRCEDCRREIAHLEDTLFSLPLLGPPVEPSPQLRERILSAARTEVAPVRGVSPGWRWLALAASITALLLGGMFVSEYLQRVDQQETIRALQREARGLREANRGLENRINQLTRPGVRFVRLNGTTEFPAVESSAFIQSDNRKVSLFIHNLPERDDELLYQLWFLPENQQPIPSNTFRSSGALTEIEVSLPPEDVNIQGLAATVEPPGGSPQPTGAMVMVGTD